jgi:hypothetical protein
MHKKKISEAIVNNKNLPFVALTCGMMFNCIVEQIFDVFIYFIFIFFCFLLFF